MNRKFSYGYDVYKRSFFTNKENEYIEYVSKKYNYCFIYTTKGSCLSIMFHRLEVFNVESEQVYKLFIEQDSNDIIDIEEMV